MSQASTITGVRARPSLDGRRIVLTGYCSDLLEFYHSLPETRSDRRSETWSCLSTPMALYRIGCQAAIRLAEPLQKQFDATFAALLQAWAARDSVDLLQPAMHKTDGWHHQLQGYWFSRQLPAALLGLEPGCGKSWIATALTINWACRKILILCPKSVLRVWPREFSRHGGEPVDVLVLDKGTVKDKANLAEKTITGLACGRRAQVVVINYDSARVSPFSDWALAQTWDCVVCDESQRAKNPSTATSKFTAKLGRVAKRRLCLTGTPMGQGPLDLFGQFLFLDPGVFGTSKWHFEHHFADHRNPAIPQMITGFKNLDELKERMAWITYHCRKEDVLDLPEQIHIDMPFTLSKDCARVYADMEQEMIAEIKGGACTASNALVKIVRLAQITSGFLVPDDSTKIVELGSDKIDLLADILEDIHEPVVVFARFRHDLALIAALAERMGRRYAELSGSRRDALDDQACLAESVEIAGVQQASGGLGIDLTRARYAMYYSLSFSLTDFDQSLSRLHRPGQKHNVTYYHLVAERSIDTIIYQALSKRRAVIDEVLSVFSTHRRPDDANQN